MTDELQRAWEERARTAAAWREGDAIGPVLEALALSVALEVTGALPDTSRRAREDLRRVGQRALLHAGAERRDDEDEEEALRIALTLARDGLRALAGRAPDPEAAPRSEPSPRDVSRLLSGRLDPFEAASIARRIRASARAREELAWALRTSARPDGTRAPLVLAAADGEPMRDPASGRRVAQVEDARTGAARVEVYAFDDGQLAAYATTDAPLRLEGVGLRTTSMQPGYWSGHAEGEGELAIALFVGEERFDLHVER
ncbi:hypothetical protein [Sandaracinus amylolyticus]|uniref:Uncharacterized protein n=1 Tax=Sandaracinus amylolyticus TaxID=927083 RepID=A0A0F6YGM6_9BACT|nr:hypothetical protein [Sandaracinus amylolyticus]AKF04866.1 hypothetical protein DB32_002015 [Sandaracinus amylolyticus]